MIVDRRNMRAEIAHILALLQNLPEPSTTATVGIPST